MSGKKLSLPFTTLVGSKLSNIQQIRGKHIVEKKYRVKYFLTAAVAAILGIFNAYERRVTAKRSKTLTGIEPPVFIIGFWRSGTTLLHTLMCQDPKSAYTTTFHSVFPNLLLTQSWWLKPLMGNLVPAERPFDNVSLSMDLPQEEEFGLMNLQPYSIYKFFLFPRDFDRIIDDELFTEKLPAEKLEVWKTHYAEMVLKSMLSIGGTRYIGKNPCNLTRIQLLKEMYPGSKFIYIQRDPYKIVESLYRFVVEIFPGVQLQNTPSDFNREKVVRLYEKIMREYLVERESLTSDELMEISMESFSKDMTGTLREIYQKLSISGFENALPYFEKYLAENKYIRDNSYNIDPETIDLVNRYVPDIVELLGYTRRV